MTNNGFSDIDLIETTDEEGKLHVFEKVEELEIEGQRYALLIYQGSGEDADGEEKAAKEGDEEEGYDEEVVVMKISEEDGAEVYEAIEDEAEFERVIAHIESITEDDDEEGETPAAGEHQHGPGCSHDHH